MPLVLRAGLLTVPRFIIILAMVIGLRRLDVSPWPEEIVPLSAYVLHFLVTFVFGVWAFRKLVPSAAQIVMVTVIFLVLGLILEMGLYMRITRASLSDITSGFTNESVYLLVIYALATIFAGLWARRSRRSEMMPEGLSV